MEAVSPDHFDLQLQLPRDLFIEINCKYLSLSMLIIIYIRIWEESAHFTDIRRCLGSSGALRSCNVFWLWRMFVCRFVHHSVWVRKRSRSGAVAYSLQNLLSPLICQLLSLKTDQKWVLVMCVALRKFDRECILHKYLLSHIRADQQWVTVLGIFLREYDCYCIMHKNSRPHIDSLGSHIYGNLLMVRERTLISCVRQIKAST